jgi:hypothetical protein
LGVTPDIFRDAFRNVRPAKPGSGGPSDEEARRNKAVLMDALGKHGVTNERLNTVSNYYRYVRSRGEHWPTTPAKGYAQVTDGKVIEFVVTEGGSGYNSPPNVTVEGMPDVHAQAKLSFSADFKKNGAVAAIVQSMGSTSSNRER